MTPRPHRPVRGRPARPLRLGLLTRWRDGRDAKRCATRQPPLPDPTAGSPTTPYLEVIRHQSLDCIEGERLAFLADTAEDRARVEVFDATHATLREAAARAREALAAATEGSALTQRRRGEAHLDDDAIRRRRRRELSGYDRAADAASTTLQHSAVEAEEARQRVLGRLDTARSRARRIIERDLARMARYRALLVRHHPDGTSLAARWQAGALQAPEWVAAETAEGALPWAA